MTTAFARASDYLAIYSVWATAKSDGVVRIHADVDAVRTSDEVGVSYITVQESRDGGDTWTTLETFKMCIRDRAIQIRDELRDLCAFKEGVRTVCLYGGQPIDKQILQLKKAPQIVVATPGRLMDHVKRRTVRLDKVETVVLDEADRMLDMGFVRDVTRILDLMPLSLIHI